MQPEPFRDYALTHKIFLPKQLFADVKVLTFCLQ